MSIKKITSGIMAVAMTMGIMYGSVFADEDGVLINEENFPDYHFRDYVASEFDDGDGILSDEEISSVKKIKSFEGHDITGIGYFVNLTYLDASYHELEKIDLSKNTALKELYLEGCGLTELDVSKNTALKILDCSFNSLTKLDISKNTALTELDCGCNKLSALDMSKNTNLKRLDCQRNNLTKLDISKNTALKELLSKICH